MLQLTTYIINYNKHIHYIMYDGFICLRFQLNKIILNLY